MGLPVVVRGLLLRCGLLDPPPPPPGRPPLERAAADVRRLGARLSSLPAGTSYCKVVAVRGAYERALGDCAAALEVTHLLEVVPPGPERDEERRRLERRLHACGLVMHDTAY